MTGVQTCALPILCFEAVMRLIEPQVITGWIVIAAASFALIVDLYTAAITYARSKDSLNMRAAFLHNLSDEIGRASCRERV